MAWSVTARNCFVKPSCVFAPGKSWSNTGAWLSFSSLHAQGVHDIRCICQQISMFSSSCRSIKCVPEQQGHQPQTEIATTVCPGPHMRWKFAIQSCLSTVPLHANTAVEFWSNQATAMSVLEVGSFMVTDPGAKVSGPFCTPCSHARVMKPA